MQCSSHWHKDVNGRPHGRTQRPAGTIASRRAARGSEGGEGVSERDPAAWAKRDQPVEAAACAWFTSKPPHCSAR